MEKSRLYINYLERKTTRQNISLPVDLENKRGQKFWQSLGFEKSKTIEDGYVFMLKLGAIRAKSLAFRAKLFSLYFISLC